MNIQLRSYLEAELSKATGEYDRRVIQAFEAKKKFEEITRQQDEASALIAGMRKLLAKADADEVASPAKKDAQEGDKPQTINVAASLSTEEKTGE